jgi:hypothetical protein
LRGVPLPRAAATLGLEFIKADVAALHTHEPMRSRSSANPRLAAAAAPRL